MVIYGNNNGKNESTVFWLTSIIKGTKGEIKLGDHSWLGEEGKHIARADLHSHSALSHIYTNEFSAYDYYCAILRKYPATLPIYLIINVGANGTLIKFTPPTNNEILEDVKELFKDKARKLLEIEGKGKSDTEIDNKIKRMPRYAAVEIVAKIIDELKGQLQETPIGDKIKFESLDPQTILWKSGVTSITIGEDNNGEMGTGIGTRISDLNRYKGRESTYDLRKTITRVSILKDLPYIEPTTFAGFTVLKDVTWRSHRENVTIPGHVKYIGKEAFHGCVSITSVTIKDGMEKIEDGAFQGCTNLKSVTIPSSVKSIGEWAFDSCIRLTSVTYLNPVPPNISADTFGSLASNACLYVPENSINVYRDAYVWKHFGCIMGFESAPRWR
jgi:hypothetical protein